MYHIYVDEAGTSEREPVTVVVGVIIHSDSGWTEAATRVRQIFDEYVPERFREGFVFHAKSVWGDKRYREGWPMEERLAFVSAMASLPREMKLAIALGKVRRDSAGALVGLSKEESDHLVAFARCMWRANKYVRDWAKRGEIATVVVEDMPKRRSKLKAMLDAVRRHPGSSLEEGYVRLTLEEQDTGVLVQTIAGQVDRIIDTVHFVTKEEAPLVQIADACAFVFRRYFAEEDYGSFWLEAMLGGPLIWEDWQGPVSQMVFSFSRKHRYRTWRLISGLRPRFAWRGPRW